MKCRAAEHKKRVRCVLYDHVKSESDKTLIHNQKNKKLWGKKKIQVYKLHIKHEKENYGSRSQKFNAVSLIFMVVPFLSSSPSIMILFL